MGDAVHRRLLPLGLVITSTFCKSSPLLIAFVRQRIAGNARPPSVLQKLSVIAVDLTWIKGSRCRQRLESRSGVTRRCA